MNLDPTLKTYLIDWGTTVALAGGICALLGIVVGWIIWKNTRKFNERVETGNRDALAEYERASDEVSRIRAELIGKED